ncbi:MULTISPECIES: aldo/keto reductase [unclassified Bartonella]|uniref:aldo/keto reductase n=1 Tax=unclassified Bartonella TaxID=2645622 RepID=UPI0015FC6C5D|nr:MULTISPECIES: aldo/keto reductase [unclassified Bartonella]UXN06121.1 aldo/keto reductase [Bartonella sp. HY761]
MEYRALGKTGFNIAPLVFGANVFGWTVDEKRSFNLLDAFVDAGLNAIDTADAYSTWAPGNKGGESETIIGNWLKQNPTKREKVVIITKVGSDMLEPGKKGLSARWIKQAAEDSLRRLQSEAIDVYLSHWPDPETSHEETLRAYEDLINSGKVRAIGCSNYDAKLLKSALDTSKSLNLPSYQVLEPEYNLYDRSGFEGELADLCCQEGLGVITYFSLASGFLSGKYRSQKDVEGKARQRMVEKYVNERGLHILDVLDGISKAHNATNAEVALAWIIAQKAVTAPIASATSLEQLASLVKATTLKLSNDDITHLTNASAF